MLSLPASVRVFFAADVCDMRRGFDALAAMVVNAFGHDPISGHLFLFRSRRGDRLKVLRRDRDGFVLWYKRLEKGVWRTWATRPPTRNSCHCCRIGGSRRTLRQGCP